MSITAGMAAVRSPAQAPRGTNRLFAAGTRAGHRAHLDTYGPLPVVGPGFVDVLEASGLTGRGGAAFAAWRKFDGVEAVRGGVLAGRPVVIANGAEGEPRSFKDRTLLQDSPHLVIDGLLVAATVLAASRVYLYTAADNMAAVEQAISERHDARKIRLVPAPDAFVAGEASAVVNAVQTGRALPTDRIRRLAEDGFKGRPTLVQNVETLAHIALIARFGAPWFLSVGSERDPGTRLLSVSGDVPVEQVLEVAGDTALTDILQACGMPAAPLTGVLVGGFHGRWVRPDDLRLSPEGTSRQVVRPGAGVIYVVGRHRCGLQATAEIVEYLAGQSARQCGPCMFGLPAMAATMNGIAYGNRDRTQVPELKRLGQMVAGRGSCHHPDGTLQLISSAMALFADDVQLHLSGHCSRAERTTP